MPTHRLERTSPIGEAFIGRCVYCGLKDLLSDAVHLFCASAPSQEQAFLESIEPDENKENSDAKSIRN